ncbi:response regulator transcription factor [Butyrivibrio sp. YAB3001]|uniref:response regulator transcription factor n=1 Tax=Butyrivibrio sp. YAB3001 TaxID=1520812 RepID=UPI001FA83FFF|nr:response regulator [Butyrivibrio sp. YAB3001]
MIKVFLVEDEFVVREGIKNNINWSAHGYDFCGEASDGEIAYSMIQKLKPDIVITDIKMPFMDGLSLSRLIKAEFPWIEIILLTGYEDFQYAREAIRIGVSCYLSKPISGDNLLKEIDALAVKIEEKKQEREATRRYEEEMKERLELDKQEFFRSLLRGGKGFSELIDGAKKLSIDISGLYYNIILLKVWSTRHDISEYSNSVVEIEEQIRAVSEKFGAVYFDLNVEGIALLVRGQTDEELQDVITNCIDEIKKIMEQYHHIRYFGGVGQVVNRVTEIPVSFNWASRAFAHIYLTSDNGFLVGSEEALHPLKEDLILSEIDPKHIDRKHIKEFLRRGESSEAEVFLQEFFNGMGPNAIKSTMLRQYIAMDFYFCVCDFVENELEITKDAMDEEMAVPTPEILADEKRTNEYLVNIIIKAVGIRDTMNCGRYHELVKETIAYIEEHYSEDDLSLNSLAAHVNFSPNHLSAVFKQETGKPFIKYLTDYRMSQARELLDKTSKKSNEIGLLVGYKDPHYFSYLFKKTQGVTITQYRGGM